MYEDYFICGFKEKVLIWQLSTGKIIKEYRVHENMINFIYRLNSEYIATSSLDKTVKIWKVDGFSLVQTLKAHQHFVSSIVSITSNNLATCSADQKIILWE